MEGEEGVSTVVIGVLMAVFALIGLTLAAGALDIEMSIFGWSLAGFSAIFIFGLVRRHFDRVTAERQGGAHGHG